MKSKILASTLLAAALISALPVEAGSIGRSSSSSSAGRSSSSSSSRSSSYSAPKPSAPAAAPAPSKPGGIGGTTASTGVRKSEVTAPVAQKVESAKPAPNAGATAGGSSSYSNPAPSYGTAPQPNYAPAAQPGISTGGVFMSSLGGSLVGNMIGNSLFGHSNHGGGTTVVNNGVPTGSAGQGVVSQGPGNSFDQSGGMSPNGVSTPIKKEYTMWSFIGDLFGFVIVVALFVGIAWVFYKGYKMVSAYVNRERGVGPSMPFQPTQQFWKIQNAFAAADLALLQTLLGPDLVDEATNGLQPSTITLHNVSHEVQLSNPREFSVHYKFVDAGAEVNQVWHFEKFADQWQLNGIENV